MSNTFATLIPETRAFMGELARNNNREWFTENKARYESQLKKPAKLLMEAIAPKLSDMLDQKISTKLFRVNRDVRFSKDKTPYAVHLHLLWTPQGNGTQPAYFFGIAEDYVTAGAGLMAFDKVQQTRWRAWVSEREGEALQTKIDAALQAGATLRKPDLKRVPSPFAQDHARAELLRHKSLSLWKDIEPEATEDLQGAILSAYTLLEPVMNDLRTFL